MGQNYVRLLGNKNGKNTINRLHSLMIATMIKGI